jgi:hypothetical protein
MTAWTIVIGNFYNSLRAFLRTGTTILIIVPFVKPLEVSGVSQFGGKISKRVRNEISRGNRENGFPIGSGIVESATKQFKARFTDPGIHWSQLGLQCLIPIRAAVLSYTFDVFGTLSLLRPQTEIHPKYRSIRTGWLLASLHFL